MKNLLNNSQLRFVALQCDVSQRTNERTSDLLLDKCQRKMFQCNVRDKSIQNHIAYCTHSTHTHSVQTVYLSFCSFFLCFRYLSTLATELFCRVLHPFGKHCATIPIFIFHRLPSIKITNCANVNIRIIINRMPLKWPTYKH